MKQVLLGFSFGISMSFISWIVGMLLNSLFMKTAQYQKFSNLNFISSAIWNKRIGMKQFKWIVKNTFFKFFNQKIKVHTKKTDLAEIRHEMTLSEISHLIGFAFVSLVAIYMCFKVGFTFGLPIMIPNVLMNLYPSLLQQENKRRIDRFLNTQKTTTTHAN